MSYETLQVCRDGDVQIIGLNRPEKCNAFNSTMLRELAAAYGELDRDASVRVGVLTAKAACSPPGWTWPTWRPISKAASTMSPRAASRLFTTEDAAIGVQAFVTRSQPEFVGR